MSVSDTVDKALRYWEVAWRWLLIPIGALLLYAFTSYAETHYVTRGSFDRAMTILSEDKQHYAEEQKTGLRDISTKLDALLLRDSANAQRFNDYDRRLDKTESKIDRLNEHLYAPKD